jgi:hypothetical protein
MPWLVFGGDENYVRSGLRVIGWRALPGGSSSRKISALRHNHMKSIGKSGKAAGRPTAYKALAVCLGK